MSDVHRFTLYDHDGDEHDYTLTLHAGSDGTTVALQLMALLSGAAAQGLVALLGSDGLLDRIAREGLDAVSTDDLAAAMSGLTGADISKALAAALGDPKTADLLTRGLVKYVTRDGKPMSNRRDFDIAYMGNYAELFRCAMEVVRANRFLPWSPT